MTATVAQARDTIQQSNHYTQEPGLEAINVTKLRQFLLDIVSDGVPTLTGAQGAQGAQGSQGAQGASGAVGAQGATGAA